MSEMILVPCNKNARDYVSKMRGVDRIDQKGKVAGRFAKRSHFHKWYKRTDFGVKDLMTNQGQVGWNMSARDQKLKRQHVTTAMFQLSLAMDMIHFVDESEVVDLVAMQVSHILCIIIIVSFHFLSNHHY